MRRPLTVLKLGGSVLRRPSDLRGAVREVGRWRRRGDVVAVVSAFAGETDRLLGRARRLGASPEATAVLLATAEHRSAALLALALEHARVPAAVLDAARLGLRTRGPLLESEPVALDDRALASAFAAGRVAVVPGFTGRCDAGRVSLLGRGGSDLTAVFLAAELGAERCRLVKDVDGIFDRDPAEGAAGAPWASLGWDRALALGGRVVQERALRLARDRGLAFEVAAPRARRATRVGPGPERRARSEVSA
jgi:homoserine dehydrogenase